MMLSWIWAVFLFSQCVKASICSNREDVAFKPSTLNRNVTEIKNATEVTKSTNPWRDDGARYGRKIGCRCLDTPVQQPYWGNPYWMMNYRQPYQTAPYWTPKSPPPYTPGGKVLTGFQRSSAGPGGAGKPQTSVPYVPVDPSLMTAKSGNPLMTDASWPSNPSPVQTAASALPSAQLYVLAKQNPKKDPLQEFKMFPSNSAAELSSSYEPPKTTEDSSPEQPSTAPASVNTEHRVPLNGSDEIFDTEGSGIGFDLKARASDRSIKPSVVSLNYPLDFEPKGRTVEDAKEAFQGRSAEEMKHEEAQNWQFVGGQYVAVQQNRANATTPKSGKSLDQSKVNSKELIMDDAKVVEDKKEERHSDPSVSVQSPNGGQESVVQQGEIKDTNSTSGREPEHTWSFVAGQYVKTPKQLGLGTFEDIPTKVPPTILNPGHIAFTLSNKSLPQVYASVSDEGKPILHRPDSGQVELSKVALVKKIDVVNSSEEFDRPSVPLGEEQQQNPIIPGESLVPKSATYYSPDPVLGHTWAFEVGKNQERSVNGTPEVTASSGGCLGESPPCDKNQLSYDGPRLFQAMELRPDQKTHRGERSFNSEIKAPTNVTEWVQSPYVAEQLLNNSLQNDTKSENCTNTSMVNPKVDEQEKIASTGKEMNVTQNLKRRDTDDIRNCHTPGIGLLQKCLPEVLRAHSERRMEVRKTITNERVNRNQPSNSFSSLTPQSPDGRPGLSQSHDNPTSQNYVGRPLVYATDQNNTDVGLEYNLKEKKEELPGIAPYFPPNLDKSIAADSKFNSRSGDGGFSNEPPGKASNFHDLERNRENRREKPAFRAGNKSRKDDENYFKNFPPFVSPGPLNDDSNRPGQEHQRSSNIAAGGYRPGTSGTGNYPTSENAGHFSGKSNPGINAGLNRPPPFLFDPRYSLDYAAPYPYLGQFARRGSFGQEEYDNNSRPTGHPQYPTGRPQYPTEHPQYPNVAFNPYYPPVHAPISPGERERSEVTKDDIQVERPWFRPPVPFSWTPTPRSAPPSSRRWNPFKHFRSNPKAEPDTEEDSSSSAGTSESDGGTEEVEDGNKKKCGEGEENCEEETPKSQERPEEEEATTEDHPKEEGTTFEVQPEEEETTSTTPQDPSEEKEEPAYEPPNPPQEDGEYNSNYIPQINAQESDDNEKPPEDIKMPLNSGCGGPWQPSYGYPVPPPYLPTPGPYPCPPNICPVNRPIPFYPPY